MITKNLNEILPPSNTDYRVKVKAMGDGQTYRDSEWSSEVDVSIRQYATPTNVVATSGQPTTLISWDAVIGATSYKVYYSSTQSGTYSLATTVYTNEFYPSTSISVLPSSGYIKIASHDSDGVFTESGKSSAVAYNIQLESPTNVTASAVEEGCPNTYITWDSVNYADSYQVYWGSTAIATVTDTHINLSDYITSFSGATDPVGIKVRATSSSYYPSEFITVNATLHLSAVTNIRFNGYTLLWDAVAGADNYDVSIEGVSSEVTVTSTYLDLTNYAARTSSDNHDEITCYVTACSSIYKSSSSVCDGCYFPRVDFDVTDSGHVVITNSSQYPNGTYRVSVNGDDVISATSSLDIDISSYAENDIISNIIQVFPTVGLMKNTYSHVGGYSSITDPSYYTAKCVKITALEDCDVTYTQDEEDEIKLFYSIDGGNQFKCLNDYQVSLESGDVMYVGGNNTTTVTSTSDVETTPPHIVIDGRANISGKITSLYFVDDVESTLPIYSCYKLFMGSDIVDASMLILPDECVSSCYNSMFYNCTLLTSIPTLSSTTLAASCYKNMFYGCTSLTTAPTLPATTLANGCYYGMFYGCTSLTTPPASLPATTAVQSCYREMFYGCTSLTTAPALSATSAEDVCCEYMFSGCTSLTTAPTLPATTLGGYCYDNMFQGCTSLTTAPTLPATTLNYGCYNEMFKGCSSLVTATALPATTLVAHCYKGMFEGCTSLTTAPTLPATTLVEECYYSMFKGCTNLITAPALPATSIKNYSYSHMFEGCSSLTTAPSLYLEWVFTCGCDSMFKDCEALIDASVISIKIVSEYGCQGMFEGCTSLTTAPTLLAGATGSAFGACYMGMFKNCTALTTAPILHYTTLAGDCYKSMFEGCSSLTTAPALPATTLAASCYMGMFKNCTSLTTAPTLPATSLRNNCYQAMFYGCTSLTTVPALPATSLSVYCYMYMFDGCTNLVVNRYSSQGYTKAWRVPTSGTGTTAEYALYDMLEDTGGTFTGTPTINTTYYIED